MNQSWKLSDITSQSTSSGFSKDAPYELNFPDSVQLTTNVGDGTDYTKYIPMTSNLMGLQRAVIPEFARGTNEAFISPTVPQCSMDNGHITAKPFPVSKKTFRIPLISAICGLLIPPDQFLLIPM